LRLRMWVLRIPAEEIFDLNYDSAPELHLEPHQLISDDYGACQDLGDRCRTDAALPKILRVPSAALPGTRNIVIFGARVAVEYLREPIDEMDIPTTVAAENAQPLATLL